MSRCSCKRPPMPSALRPAPLVLPSAACSPCRGPTLTGVRCWRRAVRSVCLPTSKSLSCASPAANPVAKKGPPPWRSWPSRPPRRRRCSPWCTCRAWTRPAKKPPGSPRWMRTASTSPSSRLSANNCPAGLPSASRPRASRWPAGRRGSAAWRFLPTRSKATCWPRTKKFKNSACSTRPAN